MNRVTLVGALAQEPENRVTQSGKNYSRINVACSDLRNWNETYFIPCVAWANSSTYISNHLHKGDFVAIDGRLSRRSFVNNEGKNTYVMEVIVDNIKTYGRGGRTAIDPTTAPARGADVIGFSDDESINLDGAFSKPNLSAISSADTSDDNELDWEEDLD